MKKILLGAVVIATIYGLLGFAISKMEDTVLSDEEIMNRIITQEYGTECYGVLCADDGDNYIEYLVYSADGMLQYGRSSDREWYMNRYK